MERASENCWEIARPNALICRRISTWSRNLQDCRAVDFLYSRRRKRGLKAVGYVKSRTDHQAFVEDIGDCDDKTLQQFFLKDSRDYTNPQDEENNNYIHKDAAKALLNIIAGATDLGLDLVFTDVFRDSKMQQRRWNTFNSGGPRAARPGTSAHEAGMAIDIYILVNGNKEVPESNKKFLALLSVDLSD